MSKGRIVKSGGPELALELERNGYRDYATRRRDGDDAPFARPRPPPRPRSPTPVRRGQAALAGDGRSPSRDAFEHFAPPACRTAASRPGTTPICARASRRAAARGAAPDADRIAAARWRCSAAVAARRRRRLVMVDGRFVAELSDRRSTAALTIARWRRASAGPTPWPRSRPGSALGNARFRSTRRCCAIGVRAGVAAGRRSRSCTSSRPRRVRSRVHREPDRRRERARLVAGRALSKARGRRAAPCRHRLELGSAGRAGRLSIVGDGADRCHLESQVASLGAARALHGFALRRPAAQ